VADKWQLWISPKDDDTVMGVAIVHRASDYGLRMEQNGMDNANRREWCDRLCKVLNAARDRGEL
jgi:hypothetical protein